MTWHILSKDCRLLWPLVMGLILAELTSAAVDITLGASYQPAPLLLLAHLMPDVVCLGIVVLTITLVQQDNLLSDRQDWLIRPVRRRSLLLAKWAFIGLLVCGPLLLIDSLESIVLGFQPAAAIEAALAHALVTLFVLTLPAFLIGSMSRTVAGALSFAAVLIIVYAVCFAVALSAGLEHVTGSQQSRLSWAACIPACALFLSGFGAISLFQFNWRRARVARGLTVTVITAALTLLLLSPWQPGFAIQRWFENAPGADRSIEIAFAPDRPPDVAAASRQVESEPPSPLARDGARPKDMSSDSGLGSSVTSLHIPIRIDGLARGSVVIADRALLSLFSADGKLLYRGERECGRPRPGIGMMCSDGGFEAWQHASDTEVARVEQAVALPTAVYELHNRERLRVRIDYLLTLLEKSSTQSMQPVNDARILRGLGSCTTRIDRDDDGIELHCIAVAHPAPCVTLTLEDTVTHRRNPEIEGCPSDYAPLLINLPPALLAHIGIDVPFLDRNGLAHFPVSTPQLREARLILETYEPRAHFARRLAISDVRLADWANPQTPRP